MTKIFKKPELGVKQREAYLASIEEKIVIAERRLVEIEEQATAKMAVAHLQFEEDKRIKDRALADLESQLVIKREERSQLEKPLTEKAEQISVLESLILFKGNQVQKKEQEVFERERNVESKLEGVQDLANQLGETRTRLTIKENLLKGREETVKRSEDSLLIRIASFKEEETTRRNVLQEAENSVKLRELNLESKDENLIKREKELLNGHILLNDQRATLARAWKELGGKTLK